jgi:hypothetical protein
MGRPITRDKECFEAILYVLKTGCQWELLPECYPPKSTVHDRFLLWKKQKATLNIPGLNHSQPMINLVPGYGRPSYFYPGNNQLSVDLGPGRFHVFEINTPNLADDLHIPNDLKAQA